MTLADPPFYQSRVDAGRELAERLAHYRRETTIVLGLPRGGVPVAAIVAARLGAPLDVVVVRKVGAPGNPEYALGAVSEGGAVFLDLARIAELGLRPHDLDREVAAQLAEVDRRVRLFRSGRSAAPVEGRVAIVVDDGLATGATARSAATVVRARRPSRMVLAVGVGAPDSVEGLARAYDEVVCPHLPPNFYAVGQWYRDFSEVTDHDVVELLERSRSPRPRSVNASA